MTSCVRGRAGRHSRHLPHDLCVGFDEGPSGSFQAYAAGPAVITTMSDPLIAS